MKEVPTYIISISNHTMENELNLLFVLLYLAQSRGVLTEPVANLLSITTVSYGIYKVRIYVDCPSVYLFVVCNSLQLPLLV